MEWQSHIEDEGEDLKSQRMDFEEKFALSTDRKAILNELVPGSVKFVYWNAIYRLQEIQKLLEENQEKNALNQLKKNEKEMDEAIFQLNQLGCFHKPKRIAYRRKILELEILYRLQEPPSKIKKISKNLAEEMKVDLIDVPPVNSDVVTGQTMEQLPSKFDESLIDEETLITKLLRELQAIPAGLPQHHCNTLKSTAMSKLSNLSPYWRDKVFRKLVETKSSKLPMLGFLEKKAIEFQEAQRWEILELFLDSFIPVYTHFEGYLEFIVSDMKRQNPCREFGERKAHDSLSLSQLETLLKLDVSLVKDSIKFALRMLKLLRASQQNTVDNQMNGSESALEDKKQKLRLLTESLRALEQLSPCVNEVRMVLLYEKISINLHLDDTRSNHKELAEDFIKYIAIPRAECEYVNRNYLSGIPYEHYVINSAHYNSTDFTREIIQKKSSMNQRYINISAVATELEMTANLTQSDDKRLIEQVLQILFNNSALVSDFEKYLHSVFVKEQFAITMIKSGKGDVNKWIQDAPNFKNELNNQFGSSEISFCESNASYFTLEEDIRVFVQVRNVKKLTVQLFEIKTTEYYMSMRKEITADICLDGLLPNEELTINLENLSPWQETRVPIEFSSSVLKNKRGVYILEVFEKGTSCRALLRKGYLRYIEQVTFQGHELFVLNEKAEPVQNASIMVLDQKSGSRLQSGREYRARDAQSPIIIPFRHENEKSSNFALVLCVEGFGYFISDFEYLAEKYSLTCPMDIDNEQLVPGARANLIMNPSLFLKGRQTRLPDDLLYHIELTIEFQEVDGGEEKPGQKYIKEFHNVAHMLESLTSYAFDIPMDACVVMIFLSAKIQKKNVDILPEVRCEKSFAVQRVTDYSSTFTPHFLRRSNPSQTEYYIQLLGQNGEPVPHVKVEVGVTHCHFKLNEGVEMMLQTDDKGEIMLGTLPDVSSVKINFTHAQNDMPYFEWSIPRLCVTLNDSICGKVNEAFEVPIDTAFSHLIESWLEEHYIGILNANTMEPYDCRVAILKNSKGDGVALSFKFSKPGTYKLFIQPLQQSYRYTICGQILKIPALSEDMLIQNQRLLISTYQSVLFIMDQELVFQDAKSKLTIRMSNSTSKTRVTVIFKRFLPIKSHDSEEDFISMDISGRHTFVVAKRTNEFLKKRKISDEYTYILNRRMFSSSNATSSLRIGSFLPKPSLLQNPIVKKESDMEALVMREGEQLSGFRSGGEMEKEAISMVKNAAKSLKKRGIATKACGYFDDSESGVPSISFLGHESAVFTNLVPDSDGQISIELEGHAFFDGLKDSSSVFEVTILAWDKSQFTSKSTSMRIDVNKNSPSKIPCRDIRLSEEEALTSNGSEKYLQTQNHECLLPGQSIELARSYSTKFALYDRLASAFDLWSAFCSDTMEVMSLTKDLKRWFQLDVKAKLDLYPSLAGSEVDFFLYMKDRVFFDRFIKPIIHGKISKSLIDYFLLDDVESLKKRYLNMGIYEQLNYVERLLLASKLPVELSIQICERVSEDIVADYPKGPRPIVLRNVFSTLLSRGAIAPSLLSPSLPCTRKTPPLPPPSPCASRGMPCAAPMSFSTRMRSSGLGNAYDDRIAGESTFDTSMDEEYVDVNRDDVESDSDGVESMTDISDETRVNEDLTESLKKKARGEKSEERAYIPPGKVRMVQEKRFYMDKKPSFSGNNMFWKEYADHIIKCKQKAKKAVSFSKLFVSSYFPEALSGFTEGLMALSVMDLALNPKSMEISNLSPSKLALKSENTSIIYHQSIEPWDNQTDSLSDQESSESTSLVVKQTLYNPEDAETTSRGFPTKRISEFVINTVYACFVCVSNIGESTISNINLLMQIPRGSIPLGEKSFYTRNETLELDPNQTKVFNFLFYFPAHGIYTHFQSQLAIDGRVVCSASNSSDKKKHIIEVLSKPSSYVDLTSWDDVCRRGNLEDVIEFLSKNTKKAKINYSKVCWRLQEETFYRSITAFLRSKFIFVSDLWKYAFYHGDLEGIREYLINTSDFREKIGVGMKTSVVSTDSLFGYERFQIFEAFDHTEFGPFIHRRVHEASGEISTLSKQNIFPPQQQQTQWNNNNFSNNHMNIYPNIPITVAGNTSICHGGFQILHAEARKFYRHLCKRLGLFAKLDHEHLLVMCYFFILFNRIDEALELFQRIQEMSLSSTCGGSQLQVQYDYMDAYLDFYRRFPLDGSSSSILFPIARQHAKRYESYPQARWSLRFKKIRDLLDEYDAFARRNKVTTISATVNDQDVKMVDVETEADDNTSLQLEAEVEKDQVQIITQNIGACELSFYPIDVELMFSTEPFDTFSDAATSASSLLLIEPRLKIHVPLLKGNETKATCTVQIPSELKSLQMMVRIQEVVSTRKKTSIQAPSDLIRSYFNTSLQVVFLKQKGVLQVLQQGNPVQSCYVKVYVKTNELGQTRNYQRKKAEFYKDGYTDIMGKFDYISINGDLIERVNKFSVLVSHDTYGAVVKQVYPPVLASTSTDFREKNREMLLY